MAENFDERLFQRLDELVARQTELNETLNDPKVASDPSRSVPLAKELGKLRRLVEPYLEFRSVQDQLEQARSIAGDPSEDGELRELAKTEIAELETECATRLDALTERMVTNEDAAISSVILEIRAGTGGDEASLFARDLYQMYLRYCEDRRFKVSFSSVWGGILQEVG